jgi:hypothetical protein
MRLWNFGFCYAACGILALGCPAGILAQGGQQTAARDAQLAGASHKQAVSSIVGASQSNRPRFASAIEETASAELPDSPGAVQSQSQSASPPQNSPSQSPTVDSSQPQTSQSPPHDGKPQRPVGTAAAEAPTVSGVTAAQPAGVAIAPAKQHRVRTLVLKVGALVGAGVALGTTLALTAGTPSKPPGAH